MSELNVRADFPALTQKIRGKSWVYLDSAATALKPWTVIERISHFYTYQTANVHRGAFYLADQATGYFEETRIKVQKFLNANLSEEIIFTKGATESLNLVAQSLGSLILKPGDEILLTEMEHHANIIPWQVIAQKQGAKIRVIPITDQGQLQMEEAQKLINSKTKILALTHCSNVLGTINDVKTLAHWAHAKGAVVVVDGAQMVANFAVDVQDLGADFYVFSAHKLFGPYGTGVLFGKKELLEKMPPYQTGGNMISEVRFEGTTYNDLPHRFEPGTPNIEGVIALGSAVDYVVEKLTFSKIHAHEGALYNEGRRRLLEIPGLKIFGDTDKKAPIISFNIEGTHPADVAQIIDQENIAVRAGHLCAQPLMRRMKTKGFVRASLSVFNDTSDLDRLVNAVIKAKEMLL
jgi:cysteine desulfurase/selenocysteine lyase